MSSVSCEFTVCICRPSPRPFLLSRVTKLRHARPVVRALIKLRSLNVLRFPPLIRLKILKSEHKHAHAQQLANQSSCCCCVGLLFLSNPLLPLLESNLLPFEGAPCDIFTAVGPSLPFPGPCLINLVQVLIWE